MHHFYKLLSLFNKKQKFKIIYIFLIVFFLSLMDLLSVGAVIPLLINISNIENSSNLLINFFADISFFSNQEDKILNSLIIILLVFLFKSILGITLNFYKNNFLKDFYVETSHNLMKNYLNIDYFDFIKKNSSHMVNVLNKEVELLVNTVLNPAIILVLELVTILFLLLLIIYLEPIFFIILIFFVSLIILLFYYFFGKRLKTLGLNRKTLQVSVQKNVLESLHGIKDIKLSNNESNFILRYFEGILKIGKITALYNTILESPKYLIELFAIILFCLITYFLVEFKNQSELILMLGIFGVITIKLLPSINRFSISAQSLRYYYPVVETIANDLNLKINNEIKKKKIIEKIDFNKLYMQNVSFSYEEDIQIFKHLNFEINKNDYIGIYGKSGEGKSTLIDIFVGLLKIQEGQIYVNGSNIYENLNNWQELIGYVPQFSYLTDESIAENIAFGVKKEDINFSRVKDAIKFSGLINYVDSLPYGIKTKVGDRGVNLSGGQKQRMGIARSLYQDRQILILDEPTSSLDSTTEKEFMDVVNSLKNKKTIILISHNFNLFKNCNKIFEVKDKQLLKINK
jgi:ABC-type multidrug transport system fused ATPase/permease subunit